MTVTPGRPAVPVLWIHGPSGVGKTTAAWAFRERLLARGVDAAYVDQLAICHPERPSDPGRHRLALRNLAAVVAAGVRCCVVSGVMDPARGVGAADLPGVRLSTCLLQADPETLTARLLRRDGTSDPGALADALCEAHLLDAVGADVRIGTSGRTVAEVVDAIDAAFTGWPGAGAFPLVAVPRPRRSAGPVLWLCGATGVGKSAVGRRRIHEAVRRSGVPVAFLDAAQIGFLGRRTSDSRRHAALLAAMWANFRDAGAEVLVVVGRLDGHDAAQAHIDALAGSTVTLCRLHAGPVELTARILRRGRGEGWPEPGERLGGRPEAELRAVAARAAGDAVVLDRSRLGLRIPTDGLTADAVADLVRIRTGWPDTR